MEERDDGAYRELPFEAEPDVDEDGDHRDQNRNDTLMRKLTRDLRTDRFDAAIVDPRTQRLLDLGDRILLRLLGVDAFLAR